MSREVRRVPLGWEHPKTKDEYRGGERYIGLLTGYPERLATWESERVDLEARRGHHWDFAVRWHLSGFDDGCQCHPGESGVRHPVVAGHRQRDLPISTEDELHAYEVGSHYRDYPDPGNYMPVWPDGTELGYCLYETVSEGTPVTPVFATAEELVDHLVAVGDRNGPYRRTAAEQLVSDGSSFGTLFATGGKLFDSAQDADVIANLPKRGDAS